MADMERPSELVQRLHKLRVIRGLTIQKMAEACGLPKSSLESYMKFSGAKRPGLDALVAIADGMQVSTDWLVGRAVDSFSPKLTQKDYAMGCFSTVSGLLIWLRQQQERSEASIIEKEAFAGVPDAEVAAKSMLVFAERMQMFQDNAGERGLDRGDLFDRLSALRDREVGTK